MFSRLSIMASITITLTGNTSHLRAQFCPEIDLSDGEYICGLVDFQTFNSIPNVDESNNLFYYGFENLKKEVDVVEKVKKVHFEGDNNEVENIESVTPEKKSILKKKRPLTCIKIPTGSYELDDLNKYLQKYLKETTVLSLEANKNTLQCEILCSQPVNFSKPNTIGPMLGFKRNEVLKENVLHESSSPADILKVNVIRIECDIIKGSYLNSHPSHTIHEFSPRVSPGYKIIEVPQNVIYFPVTVKSLRALSLSIIDQQNRPINFRGETITARLHLIKKP